MAVGKNITWNKGKREAKSSSLLDRLSNGGKGEGEGHFGEENQDL